MSSSTVDSSNHSTSSLSTTASSSITDITRTPPLSSSCTFQIRHAILQDIPHLSAVELSAASRFRSIPALAYLADLPPLKQCFLTSLIHGHDDSRLLVACSSTNESSSILGFLAAFRHDSHLFIAEMLVALTAQSQGIGTALLAAAMAEAKILGLAGVSLTTYKEVAFNGPWYAKRGFDFIPAEQLGPCHVEGLANEIRLGLCKTGWTRSCMVKNLCPRESKCQELRCPRSYMCDVSGLDTAKNYDVNEFHE